MPLRVHRRRIPLPDAGRPAPATHQVHHFDPASATLTIAWPHRCWCVDLHAENVIWSTPRTPAARQEPAHPTALRVVREQPACVSVPDTSRLIELQDYDRIDSVRLTCTDTRNGLTLWSRVHAIPPFVRVPNCENDRAISRGHGDVQARIDIIDGLPVLIWARATGRAGPPPKGIEGFCKHTHFRWTLQCVDARDGTLSQSLDMDDCEDIDPGGFVARGNQLFKLNAVTMRPELLFTADRWIRDFIVEESLIYIAWHKSPDLYLLAVDRAGAAQQRLRVPCRAPQGVQWHVTGAAPLIQINEETAIVPSDDLTTAWTAKCIPSFGRPWKHADRTFLASYGSKRVPPQLHIHDTATGEHIESRPDPLLAGNALEPWYRLPGTNLHLSIGLAPSGIAGPLLMNFGTMEIHVEPGGALGGIRALTNRHFFTVPGGPDPTVLVYEVEEL